MACNNLPRPVQQKTDASCCFSDFVAQTVMDFLPSLPTVFPGTLCGISSMLAINSYHCFLEHASTLHEIEQFCAQDQLEQVGQLMYMPSGQGYAAEETFSAS